MILDININIAKLERTNNVDKTQSVIEMFYL